MLGSGIKGHPCGMTASVVFLTTEMNLSPICWGAETRTEVGLTQEKKRQQHGQKKKK